MAQIIRLANGQLVGVGGGYEPLPVQLSGSNAVLSGTKSVVAAGTAEALAASTAVREVTVRARAANSGNVYVGSSATDSSTGFPLAANEALTLKVSDLAAVYIDADANGDGVNYVAEAA